MAEQEVADSSTQPTTAAVTINALTAINNTAAHTNPANSNILPSTIMLPHSRRSSTHAQVAGYQPNLGPDPATGDPYVPDDPGTMALVSNLIDYLSASNVIRPRGAAMIRESMELLVDDAREAGTRIPVPHALLDRLNAELMNARVSAVVDVRLRPFAPLPLTAEGVRRYYERGDAAARVGGGGEQRADASASGGDDGDVLDEAAPHPEPWRMNPEPEVPGHFDGAQDRRRRRNARTAAERPPAPDAAEILTRMSLGHYQPPQSVARRRDNNGRRNAIAGLPPPSPPHTIPRIPPPTTTTAPEPNHPVLQIPPPHGPHPPTQPQPQPTFSIDLLHRATEGIPLSHLGSTGLEIRRLLNRSASNVTPLNAGEIQQLYETLENLVAETEAEERLLTPRRPCNPRWWRSDEEIVAEEEIQEDVREVFNEVLLGSRREVELLGVERWVVLLAEVLEFKRRQIRS